MTTLEHHPWIQIHVYIFPRGWIILFFQPERVPRPIFHIFTVFNKYKLFSRDQDPPLTCPPLHPSFALLISIPAIGLSSPTHLPSPPPKKKHHTSKLIDEIQGQRLMKHFLNIYSYLIDKETTRSKMDDNNEYVTNIYL